MIFLGALNCVVVSADKYRCATAFTEVSIFGFPNKANVVCLFLFDIDAK